MAANLELLVLNRIIETRDYHTIQKMKITEDFFAEPIYRDVFRYLREHFHNPQTFGTIPSFQFVKDIYTAFSYVPQYDELSGLCEHLRVQKMRNQVLVLAQKLMAEAEFNPRMAIESLREATSNLSSQHDITEDLLLSSAHDQLRRDYDLIASGHGITGLPWPWEILNNDTQGMHKGDFYVIYGRPKSMKSWVGLAIGVHAYLEAQARVLVYSMEMKPIRVLRRCATLLAKVDYEQVLKGTMNPYDRDRFFHLLAQLSDEDRTWGDEKGHVPAFLVTGRGKGDKTVGGVSSLQAKIREFKPDLVIVDGMYLMRDDRGNVRTVDWKAVAHISQDLKATAQDLDIPLIGITQGKRGSAKDSVEADLDELSYADAIGQDTDLAIRVKKRTDKTNGENEIVLGFPGTRETKLNAFTIFGHPGHNLGFKSEIVLPDDPAAAPQGHNNGGNNSSQAGRTVPVLPRWNGR